MTLSSHLFETSFGWAGLAWSNQGVRRLLLPERDRGHVERRLAALGTDAAPAGWVADLVGDIKRYFDGEAVNFDDVPLDLAGVDDFRLSIYAAAKTLKSGETTTYGGLAARAGQAGLPRETGQALGSNPIPLIIPCHRILAAGGKIGGFSAPGGAVTKEKMLRLEGARVGPPPAAQQSFAF